MLPSRLIRATRRLYAAPVDERTESEGARLLPWRLDADAVRGRLDRTGASAPRADDRGASDGAREARSQLRQRHHRAHSPRQPADPRGLTRLVAAPPC